jgi:hypothetical protein
MSKDGGFSSADALDFIDMIAYRLVHGSEASASTPASHRSAG